MVETKEEPASAQQPTGAPKVITVTAYDADTAARVIQVFDRTAKMMKATHNFVASIVRNTGDGADTAATVEIAQRFALELVKMYPESGDFAADWEMFSTLQIDKKAVM